MLHILRHDFERNDNRFKHIAASLKRSTVREAIEYPDGLTDEAYAEWLLAHSYSAVLRELCRNSERLIAAHHERGIFVQLATTIKALAVIALARHPAIQVIGDHRKAELPVFWTDW